MAVCLVGRPDVVVGCDLERVEPRPVGFAADWFTAAEQQVVAAARADRRDEVVTAIWSAKESALKAIGEGLRLDTRTVEVDVGRCRDGGAAFGWPCPVEVAATGGSSAGRAGARRSFAGWMRRTGPHVLVLLAEGGLLRHAPPGMVLGEPAASTPSGDGGLAVGMELVR